MLAQQHVLVADPEFAPRDSTSARCRRSSRRIDGTAAARACAQLLDESPRRRDHDPLDHDASVPA